MSKVLANRYELFERVGEGGMSVVYKAKDRLLNRFVAIKILKPEFIGDQKFIESFRRESQNAASMSHPNIVNIYDVGREGNIHYIVKCHNTDKNILGINNRDRCQIIMLHQLNGFFLLIRRRQRNERIIHNVADDSLRIGKNEFLNHKSIKEVPITVSNIYDIYT